MLVSARTSWASHDERIAKHKEVSSRRSVFASVEIIVPEFPCKKTLARAFVAEFDLRENRIHA
ncbi:hypothetical protein GN958_ATG21208 [Phytophthora infestans]|uniref:Uncharacterized protein n=1 Tax=Phytophthora infestans TaxID=4787 RepID=A0A8S9TNZ2_PHYIN|nr:hypothetical protein GN958_ATG21208 [Phytophthora infestans]